MKAYKGFDKNMKCRGFQYVEGETYELPEGQDAKLCERGFHSCERPVDVLRYYDAGNAVFHEVEVDGVDTERGDDTKLSARKIHIGARMSIAQMVEATIEYNREHCTTEHTDPKQASAGTCGAASAGTCGAASAGEGGAASAGECGAASAGYRGAASAGEGGAASAGECGAASAGTYGTASAGECGAASAGTYGTAVSKGSASVGANGIACVRGNGCRVRGGMGAVLVIAEENTNNYDIASWRAVIVDGETIKADTWYMLVDGELVEAADE